MCMRNRCKQAKRLMYTLRHAGASIGLHCPRCSAMLHSSSTALPSSAVLSSSYPCCYCFGLDATLDLCRRATDMARMGRNVGKGGWIARTGNRPGRMS